MMDYNIISCDVILKCGDGCRTRFRERLCVTCWALRELPSRLKNVDFVITNGGKNAYSDAIMQLVPHYAINLVTAEKRLLSEFTQGSAIAGIGNPQRFFTMLEI